MAGNVRSVPPPAMLLMMPPAADARKARKVGSALSSQSPA
jgi:hypothetical protein